MWVLCVRVCALHKIPNENSRATQIKYFFFSLAVALGEALENSLQRANSDTTTTDNVRGKNAIFFI